MFTKYSKLLFAAVRAAFIAVMVLMFIALYSITFFSLYCIDSVVEICQKR